MATFRVYIDALDFINDASANVETASLIGGNTTLATTAAQGAVSLSLVSATGFAASGNYYLLDGNASEIVAGTLTGTTLSVPAGTLAPHSAGVNVCSAGVMGNLPDIIRSASALAENICAQGPDGGDRGLYAISRVETLKGPSTYRAAYDREGQLVLHPYRFPVQSVTSISVQIGANSPVGVSTTYLVIPDGGRMIYVPAPAALTANTPVTFYSRPSRSASFVATLTYTGGPCGTDLTTVPWDFKEAVRFIILDRLSFRTNNLGAVGFHRGDFSFQHAAHVRAPNGTGGAGDSLFMKQAREKLDPYTRNL